MRGRLVKTGVKKNVMTERAGGEEGKGHLVSVGRAVAFPIGSVVKNPFAIQELQETRVRSLGQEDPVEKGKATYSSILAWIIPWTEEPGGLQSMGPQNFGFDFFFGFKLI